ncbi:DUF4118 domain-containing protein, partial [Enterobacter intestinihominis]
MVKTSVIFLVWSFIAIKFFLIPEEVGGVPPFTWCWVMTRWFYGFAGWFFFKFYGAGAATDTLPGVPYQI